MGSVDSDMEIYDLSFLPKTAKKVYDVLGIS